jgi:hypothetical protein
VPNATPTRSYRCTYYPRPDECVESGVLPFLQLQARGAEQAQQLAFATVNRPIASVERIEPCAEVAA